MTKCALSNMTRYIFLLLRHIKQVEISQYRAPILDPVVIITETGEVPLQNATLMVFQGLFLNSE